MRKNIKFGTNVEDFYRKKEKKEEDNISRTMNEIMLQQMSEHTRSIKPNWLDQGDGLDGFQLRHISRHNKFEAGGF